MKAFFTRLFCGKDIASLISENKSLKAQVESLKKELATIRLGVQPQDATNKMIVNPPNSRKPN
jgi:hypothetical protein